MSNEKQQENLTLKSGGSRTKKFMHNSISTAVYQVILMISGFITPKIMLDCYGSEVNGLVSSIQQFMTHFQIVEAGIRTPNEVGVCEFGGDALIMMNGSRLTLFGECLALEKLVVPSGSSAEVYIGQGLQSLAKLGVTNTAVVATNILVDGTLALGAYTSREIGINGPVSGTGEVVMYGVDGSSSYTGYYSFGADNSGFTGRMRISMHPTLQSQGHTNQTFTVYSATDFGGNRATFDYKAMTLELGGHLNIQKPRTNSSGNNNYLYVAPTNCGLYVSGKSDMNVNYAGGNLVWPSSLTLDGTFRKRGSGRLALGGPMKFISGGHLSDTPTEGKNVIDWEGGRIHPLVHDALDGAQVRLVASSQNGFVHLKLEQDYSDPLLMRYGIKNTKTATPFSRILTASCVKPA